MEGTPQELEPISLASVVILSKYCLVVLGVSVTHQEIGAAHPQCA